MHHAPALADVATDVTMSPHHPPLTRLPDPLDHDRADDAPILTSERRLQRLAIVAADAGARFASERSSVDAVAWMLAPRGLFDGRRALEACQERAPFLRATLLHGLRLGLDAEPDELDALLAEDADDPADEVGAEEPLGVDPRFEPSSSRLFVCEVEGAIGSSGRRLQAVWAMIAPDGSTARRRVAVRHGEALAASARVAGGLDREAPLVRELLSPALIGLIGVAAADPSGELACGLDVHVERRFLP